MATTFSKTKLGRGPASIARLEEAGTMIVMIRSELGPRICVMGPSNSGKSTLAEAIGRAQGLPVVHLDTLRHFPNTDYRMRPDAEFVALHDVAIAADRWVMDGNYSVCLPQRLKRATGLILLDVSIPHALLRYFRRCWSSDRRGGLEGGKESVGWEMIRHIVVDGSATRNRLRRAFYDVALPKIYLGSTRELSRFSRSWGLDR